MKKILLTILLFSYISGFAQYEEDVDVSDALQAALNVKSAAVKITKNYLYRGLKVSYVLKENDDNLAIGEENIMKLEIYAEANPDLSDDTKNVIRVWKNTRVLAIHKPEKKKMNGILKLLNNFLNNIDKLIVSIKQSGNVSVLEYQHASNEMEILAQQLSLLHAMNIAGINDPMIGHEIERCTTDFQKNLDKTFFSGENTIDVVNVLKNVQADWEMTKRTLSNTDNERFLNTLYILMNKVSNAAHKAALLYQQKAKADLKK
jgi:hypothetical protein